MSKLQIAVLFGGVSTEHDVSCMSATTIMEHLDRLKYELILVGITKEGHMLRYTGKVSDLKSGNWKEHDVTECTISVNRAQKGILCADGTLLPVDCVIPVLHGKNGEDGTIQGLLQLADIPFVGCDAISSANCMDKELTHIVLGNAGVRMARWVAVRRWEPMAEAVARLEQALDYPMFIKPANAGSSFGVSKAQDRAALEVGLLHAFEHDSKAIVEETIVGKEVECAVLGNEDAEASTVGEIEPANEFYDFDAKYVDASSKLHIPARIPAETIERIRETAVRAYHAIGCSGLSRVDFFVTEGEVILNEINTFPGFTSISMYPKLWESSGVPIAELLDRLIAYGMQRR